MKHYVYKVTFPGMPWFYYGVHTDNGRKYSGSPKTHKWVWEFYEFEIEILQYFESREEANSIEKRIIDYFLNDSNCLNECSGGKFSLDALRQGALIKNSLPVKQSTKDKISSKAIERWNSDFWDKKHLALEKLKKSQPIASNASRTKKSNDKRKQTMLKNNHAKGERNSQYGTMWITNGQTNKKIMKDGLIPDGFRKGRVIK